ncbi:hypothetical protein GGI13_007570 [Coemansia sp. RSA 455]|nr:hypothetical protein H4S04_000663 [Coemansia sp. S16]KAJ2240733.1 hypothetical protein GGI13_007570 [Coemansia sp. RSA 455]
MDTMFEYVPATDHEMVILQGMVAQTATREFGIQPPKPWTATNGQTNDGHNDSKTGNCAVSGFCRVVNSAPARLQKPQ